MAEALQGKEIHHNLSEGQIRGVVNLAKTHPEGAEEVNTVSSSCAMGKVRGRDGHALAYGRGTQSKCRSPLDEAP